MPEPLTVTSHRLTTQPDEVHFLSSVIFCGFCHIGWKHTPGKSAVILSFVFAIRCQCDNNHGTQRLRWGVQGYHPHPKLVIVHSGKIQCETEGKERLKKAINILFPGGFPSPNWNYLLTDKSVCISFSVFQVPGAAVVKEGSYLQNQEKNFCTHWSQPILGQKKQSILSVICSQQEVNCFAQCKCWITCVSWSLTILVLINRFFTSCLKYCVRNCNWKIHSFQIKE